MAKKEVLPPLDRLVLYLIHLQDIDGEPLSDIEIDVVSPNGDWSSRSNACGDVMDPGSGLAGVSLTQGHYTARFYDHRGSPLLVDGTTEALEWDLAWPPEKPILVGLTAGPHVVGSLPPPPTRAQVCSIQTSLQGLMYHTRAYGEIPAWFYAGLDEDDRLNARNDHRAIKDTHIHISISAAYKEHGTLWPEELKEGYDFTQDLEAFRVILYETICDGFLIDMPLAGDGLGDGPEYNDPVGKTYGHEWLMANLERIIRGLQGDGSSDKPDLTPYIIFRPGWDAVFYGWGGSSATRSATASLRWSHTRTAKTFIAPTTQQLDEQQLRVKKFGELFRQILPAGYLAIEHTPGNIPCGEGGGDYAPGGLMRTFDTIMAEFNTVHEDSCWQILGRMISPYHRPADQPAGDDPNPPFYLAPGTERGPYYFVAFEPTKGGVYEWCRGLCTLEQVREVDAYLRSCGCTLTGYSGG